LPIIDYLVVNVIETFKELVHRCPTTWPNDKPRPHLLFLCIKHNGDFLMMFGLVFLLLGKTKHYWNVMFDKELPKYQDHLDVIFP
jgi:hypothetical protein